MSCVVLGSPLVWLHQIGQITYNGLTPIFFPFPLEPSNTIRYVPQASRSHPSSKLGDTASISMTCGGGRIVDWHTTRALQHFENNVIRFSTNFFWIFLLRRHYIGKERRRRELVSTVFFDQGLLMHVIWLKRNLKGCSWSWTMLKDGHVSHRSMALFAKTCKARRCCEDVWSRRQIDNLGWIGGWRVNCTNIVNGTSSNVLHWTSC